MPPKYRSTVILWDQPASRRVAYIQGTTRVPPDGVGHYLLAPNTAIARMLEVQDAVWFRADWFGFAPLDFFEHSRWYRLPEPFIREIRHLLHIYGLLPAERTPAQPLRPFPDPRPAALVPGGEPGSRARPKPR